MSEQKETVADLTIDELKKLIEESHKEGIRSYFEDEHVSKDFWEKGFAHLSTHATNGISQWVGKRILMILLAGVLSASVTWAVITGRVK